MSTELWAVLASVITAALLKLGDWLINRNKDTRDARKDLRDEIKDLWAHTAEQDTRLADKDKEIAELRGRITADEFWKQRYQSVALENTDLHRKITQMEAHIAELERKVRELERSR